VEISPRQQISESELELIMAKRKVKVGIVGCGAIGSRIAKAIKKDLNSDCQLAGIYDINGKKSIALAKSIKSNQVIKSTLAELISDCECMVEAVNADNTEDIIRKALQSKRNILSMSVGKLLNAQYLFDLANKNKCHILIPSGAIAGIDAIKAASLTKIKKIVLTTRKPTKGFQDNPYFVKNGIDLSKIKKETILFEGKVDSAVKIFPQNINVAATLALACQHSEKLSIRIITSPHYQKNSHEIELSGDFGTITTKTDNEVCPDNPKTSYLAVLSGIQTLKQFCTGVNIGT